MKFACSIHIHFHSLVFLPSLSVGMCSYCPIYSQNYWIEHTSITQKENTFAHEKCHIVQSKRGFKKMKHAMLLRRLIDHVTLCWPRQWAADQLTTRTNQGQRGEIGSIGKGELPSSERLRKSMPIDHFDSRQFLRNEKRRIVECW